MVAGDCQIHAPSKGDLASLTTKDFCGLNGYSPLRRLPIPTYALNVGIT
jgi:hypothetical protein